MPLDPAAILPDSIIAQARSQSLSAMLNRAAERHGEKTAIICGNLSWSYAAFRREVDRLAAGLRSLGLAPGDRIAVLARNSHAFIALRFAIAQIGRASCRERVLNLV